MSHFLFAAAAAVATLAAPAAFADERSFTRDGVTYTYTVTQKNDVQVLEGRADRGVAFRLTVKDGWVDGYVDRARVSFRAPKRKGGAEVATR